MQGALLTRVAYTRGIVIPSGNPCAAQCRHQRNTHRICLSRAAAQSHRVLACLDTLVAMNRGIHVCQVRVSGGFGAARSCSAVQGGLETAGQFHPITGVLWRYHGPGTLFWTWLGQEGGSCTQDTVEDGSRQVVGHVKTVVSAVLTVSQHPRSPCHVGRGTQHTTDCVYDPL